MRQDTLEGVFVMVTYFVLVTFPKFATDVWCKRTKTVRLTHHCFVTMAPLTDDVDFSHDEIARVFMRRVELSPDLIFNRRKKRNSWTKQCSFNLMYLLSNLQFTVWLYLAATFSQWCLPQVFVIYDQPVKLPWQMDNQSTVPFVQWCSLFVYLPSFNYVCFKYLSLTTSLSNSQDK